MNSIGLGIVILFILIFFRILKELGITFKK